MPHSFGCEATGCLIGICPPPPPPPPPVKDFSLGVSVVILDDASVLQILKGLGASTVQ